MGSDAHCATQGEFDLINMMLLIKDKYCISGRGYHEMASVCKEMPRHYKLKRRIKELNSLWNITPAPNGILGVQQSLEDRLFIRISRLLKTAPEDAAFKKDGTIRVKLSGDGTRTGKRLHVTNFTFTILDEGLIAHTSEGNYILAIVKVPEKYEDLKLALEDICHDVERLDKMKVDTETFQMKYFLGGDLKFLAIILGIDCAMSKYACPWCTCSLDERGDLQKKWSINDPAFGARTAAGNI